MIDKGVEISDVVDTAISSLLDSGVYNYKSTSDATKLASKLRLAGHKDVIDNLLYATSITRSMIFLTMDKALKDFLIKHGLNTESLMDHRQLLRRLGFD